MSINSALDAIYSEKLITPKMEAFLTQTVKSRTLTVAERRALRELVQRIERGEIILLSAQ
ncbi:hypothetical protein Lepto7376_0722 [[Leptolyngbya] sp. PCC 7376]|uniref:hypothetical protein n=1 Tax=[Leptolyngbya] sp. PCC 7376 TaxID=111781 RepID=UPI00029F1163|nr:hypothetical protein [[Leptolyngbya] sp. PCC 7376]AFY37120.1 hypothetical protein Lepto7376_0722 [[Leptolyngbya] sp. PCC 7376]